MKQSGSEKVLEKVDTWNKSGSEKVLEKVNKWNKYGIGLTVFYQGIFLYFVIFFAVYMDYSELFSEQQVVGAVSGIFCMCCFSFTYGVQYASKYVLVQGKKGKEIQSLLESMNRIPCSIEAVLGDIHRKFKKKMAGLCMVSFVLLMAGMFVSLQWIVRGERGIRMPEDLLQSFLVCVVGTILIAICMCIGFAFYKKAILLAFRKKAEGKIYGEKRKRK